MTEQITFTLGAKNYLFRQPNLGNQDELSFQRVNRRTRGGDLIIYRDGDWPKTEILTLTFDFNSDKEAKDMLTMIRETLGTFITYLDHENKLWSGVIQNPDAEIVQQGKNSFVITLRFEGDLA